MRAWQVNLIYFIAFTSIYTYFIFLLQQANKHFCFITNFEDNSWCNNYYIYKRAGFQYCKKLKIMLKIYLNKHDKENVHGEI